MKREDLIDLIMYALSNEGFMSASDIVDTWLEKKSNKSSTSNEALTLPTIEQAKKVCGTCNKYNSCKILVHRNEKSCNIYKEQTA